MDRRMTAAGRARTGWIALAVIALVIGTFLAFQDQSEPPTEPMPPEDRVGRTTAVPIPEPTVDSSQPTTDAPSAPRPQQPDTPHVPPPVEPDATEKREVRWVATGRCTTPTYDDGKPIRPIPGAKVTLWVRLDGEYEYLRFPPVIADDDGRFEVDLARLRQTPPFLRSRITWHAEAHTDEVALVYSYSNLDRLPTPPVRDDVAYRPNLALQLESAIVLTGTVRDPLGRLAKHAILSGVDDEGYEVWRTEAWNGRFAGIMAEEGKLSVYASSDEGISKPIAIVVKSDGPRRIALPDLILEKRRSVDGFVHYPDGTPARFLPLECESGGAGETVPPWRTGLVVTTERNGRFVAHGLGPTPYIVTIVNFAHEEGHEPFVIRREAASVRFEVRHRRLIVQTTWQGRPIGGIPVGLARLPNDHGEPTDDTQVIAIDPRTGVGSTPAAPGSTLRLTVREPGIVPIRRVVRFPSDRWDHLVTLALEPLHDAASLVVEFRDERDEPLDFAVNVSLTADGDAQPMSGLHTDYRHGDRIDGLAPGRYRFVTAEDHDRRSYRNVDETITLSPGENRFVARMPAFGRIGAVIVCADRPTAVAVAAKGEQHTRMIVQDAEGNDVPMNLAPVARGKDVCLRTPPLDPGRYHVRISVGGRELVSKAVVVKRLWTAYVRTPLDR